MVFGDGVGVGGVTDVIKLKDPDLIVLQGHRVLVSRSRRRNLTTQKGDFCDQFSHNSHRDDSLDAGRPSIADTTPSRPVDTRHAQGGDGRGSALPGWPAEGAGGLPCACPWPEALHIH